MLGNKLQRALSALSCKTPSLDPVFGPGGSTSSSRLSRTSEVSAALGMINKDHPLGSVLLEAVYTDKPRIAETVAREFFAVTISSKFVDEHPVVARPLIRLALGELCFLAGSRRCSCKGRVPGCDKCGGDGVRPNQSLSQRARVSMMNGAVSRRQWRQELEPVYEEFLTMLIERLDEAAVALSEQLRPAEAG